MLRSQWQAVLCLADFITNTSCSQLDRIFCGGHNMAKSYRVA